MSRWLERSGQAWKLNGALVAGLAGFGLLALGAVDPDPWAAMTFVIAPFVFGASVLLPELMRCRVCGLHMLGSRRARELPRFRRSIWIRTLDGCPACGDDGAATTQSRERWRTSGLAPEGSYWSAKRMVLAILATVLLAGGGYVFGALYRIGH